MSQAVVVVVTKQLSPTSFFVCSLSFYALFVMLVIEVRTLSSSLESFTISIRFTTRFFDVTLPGLCVHTGTIVCNGAFPTILS